MSSELPPYVLYVGDGDLGSTTARAVAAPLGATAVLEQRVSELDRAQLPAWLNGYPILVRTSDGSTFKGTAAVRALEEAAMAVPPPPPRPRAPPRGMEVGAALAAKAPATAAASLNGDECAPLGMDVDTSSTGGIWPESEDGTRDEDVPESSERQLRMFSGGDGKKVSGNALQEYISLRG